MAETLCPSCGFGPIDEGADECPKCSTQFAKNPLYQRVLRDGGHGRRKDAEDLEATKTTLGGNITSAVQAHPVPTAAILVATTVAWLARIAGVLSERPQPWWPLVLAMLMMGVALMLVLAAGPGKQLAQMLAIAEIAVGYLAGEPALAQLGFCGVGVALLVMTIGEPGDARRWLGLGAAIASLLFGIWGTAGT